MNTPRPTTGTLYFTLFGIPVCIHPSIWLILFLLGLSNGNGLMNAAVFVVMGMLALLAHELGHALAGRYFTKEQPYITLAMMGGVTELRSRPRTRTQYFLYVLAGPAASLLLGLIVAIIMGLHVGNVATGINFYLLAPFSQLDAMPFEQQYSIALALENGTIPHSGMMVYSTAMFICMWWSIFNLLPILPLDGGQLLLTVTNNLKLCSTVGMILGGALAVLSLMNGMIFFTLFMAYFAYINWQISRGAW